MLRHLRAALKWGSIVAVPLTLAALWVWNPHGNMTAEAKIFGMFFAYPFLFVSFELRGQLYSTWVTLPLAVLAQFAWCILLALPVCVVSSWAARKGPPSNSTPHADARDAPASASSAGARAGGRER